MRCQGLVALRSDASISSFREHLATRHSGAILRYSTPGRPQEGLPNGTAARLLSPDEATQLLQSLEAEKLEKMQELQLSGASAVAEP